jgi:DNA-binding HxlR family transcriptional regulator
MKNVTEQPLCVQSALKIVGDKWTAMILRDILQDINTFSALEKSLDTISPRTLSQRLDMLQAEGIVLKEQYCKHPPRYQYVLTQKGTELQEVIQKMAEWGGRYYNDGDKLDCSTFKSEC